MELRVESEGLRVSEGFYYSRMIRPNTLIP